METSNSDDNHFVLHSQNDREVWDPWKLVILMLIKLF